MENDKKHKLEESTVLLELLTEAQKARVRDDLSEEILEHANDLYNAANEIDNEPLSEKHAQRLLNGLQLLIKQHENFMQQNEEMKSIKADRDSKNFLLKIGDWAGAVFKAVKNTKSTASEKHQEDIVTELMAQGLTKDKANKRLGTSNNWRVGLKANCSAIQFCLDVERKEVHTWRENGEKEEDAPATPIIDRLTKIGDLQGVGGTTFLKTIDLYAERNKLAHDQPPDPIDYVDAEGKLSWEKIWWRVKEVRHSFQEMQSKGEIDPEQAELAMECLHAWGRLHIEMWPGTALGSPVLTPVGKNVEETAQRAWANRLKEAAKTPKQKEHEGKAPPMSFYKKGKWNKTVPKR